MLPSPLPTHAAMLQGPNGPFFRRYARDLESAGVRVTKFNFHPGESLFFRGDNVRCFRGTLASWPDVFREYAVREGVDAVLLFGDCRPIHTAIRTVTDELSIDVWVFEEGYIRPNFITLERNGVNGNSKLPSDADFYRRLATSLPPPEPEEPIGQVFYWSALWAILNAVSNTLFGWRYPNYRHHRDINAIRQGLLWIRGGYRKFANGFRQRDLLDVITTEHVGRYFFVPLQVHCDSQIKHSDFASVDEFIREVTVQFARSAPDDTLLVIKHHPKDRPYRDYRKLLAELSREHGLDDRLIYVHDLHLPALLKNARGTITMNSTVGLSSLYRGTPVKALGKAVYNFPGLTFQGSLADFFTDPGVVDAELHAAFASYVRYETQINGTFHKRLARARTASGLIQVRRSPPPRRHNERQASSPSAS